jgi:hypothetical protein
MPSCYAFRRLPEMTANIVTGYFVFQTAGQPLQQATVQIISDSSCNSTYYYRGGITDRMICAEDPNGGKGACEVIGSWEE